MDWARCANGRRKESMSKSRKRAQMDEDTVPLELDDDADFFDQQSTKKISKEARQDRSGSGKGTTIPIAKMYNQGLFSCLFSWQHLWVLHIFVGRGLEGHGLGEMCQ